jgi:replicative DNA helicase
MKVFEILVESYKPAMKLVLMDLIKLLESNHIEYIVGGAQALTLYSKRPRMTVDIDIFADAQEKQKLDKLMVANFNWIDNRRYHSKFERAGVEIDILYAGSDAELFAIKHKKRSSILDVQLYTANPEALLWLYVVSDKDQNTVDGIEVIRGVKDLDLELVRAKVKRYDPKLVDKLELMIEKGSKPEAQRKRE